jgi:hypothetical protein
MYRERRRRWYLAFVIRLIPVFSHPSFSSSLQPRRRRKRRSLPEQPPLLAKVMPLFAHIHIAQERVMNRVCLCSRVQRVTPTPKPVTPKPVRRSRLRRVPCQWPTCSPTTSSRSAKSWNIPATCELALATAAPRPSTPLLTLLYRRLQQHLPRDVSGEESAGQSE